MTAEDPEGHCWACRVDLRLSQYDEHIKSVAHQRNFKYWAALGAYMCPGPVFPVVMPRWEAAMLGLLDSLMPATGASTRVRKAPLLDVVSRNGAA